MRALQRARAALLEGPRAALVGDQPPAAERGRVDGRAHERVPEAEAARDVGVADEVAAQELVERVDRVPLGHRGGDRGQLGLERVARDRGAREHLTGAVGELRDLARERRRDRARDLDARERDGRPGRQPLGSACELLQVERVPAGGGDRASSARSPTSSRASLGVSSPSSIRRTRSSAAASRSGTWRGRTASASSTGAAGGRRSSEPSSSSEPESAQCRSSRISTRGFGPASSSSSARAARCRR